MTELPGLPADHQQAERIAALGQVAGELMHDMSNLLAMLDGRSQLVLSEARAGRASAEQMERIAEVTGEMSAMVRDTMEFLRGRAVSPEVVFAPAEVAERVISRFLSTSPTLEIRLISGVGAHVRIAGRSSFFSRTLTNLLTNAARHARGQVRVEIACAPPQAGRRRVSVAVEDDGAGVPPELVPRVFQPLVRAAENGTGLGLSSVEWAVRQLGGDVLCRQGSELGGARFELLLPVAESWQAPPPRVPAELLAGCRVGVLDDQPGVRSALSRLLRRLGAAVEEMDSAESAHATAEALLRTRPDAILLDLKLGAQSGLDVWNAVRELEPEAAGRAVFMSGLAVSNPLLEAAAATGRPVLNKPFDLDQLAELVGAAARRA